MSDEQSDRGFKVEDRRRFSSSGDVRPEASDREESPPVRPAPEAPPSAAHESLPEMTFSTFLFSLSTQALILLGEVHDPSGAPAPDLVGAKQLIDIVGMLKTKTNGNLDAAEANLLDNILYDLRMKYVQRTTRK